MNPERLLTKLHEAHPEIEWSIEHLEIRGNETPVVVGKKNHREYAVSLNGRAAKRINQKLLDTIELHIVGRFRKDEEDERQTT